MHIPASILRSLFYSLITHRPVTARHFVELLLDTQYFLLGTHRRRSHSATRCTKSIINRRECGQQHSTPLVDAHGAHDRVSRLLAMLARDTARQPRTLMTLSEFKIPRNASLDWAGPVENLPLLFFKTYTIGSSVVSTLVFVEILHERFPYPLLVDIHAISHLAFKFKRKLTAVAGTAETSSGERACCFSVL